MRCFEDKSNMQSVLDCDVSVICEKVKGHIKSSEKERTVCIMTHKKKLALVAVCATLILGITAAASGFGGNIIKMITTGYNSYVQVDPDAPHHLPDELVGKIFDENGIMLESLTKDDIDNIYNENGEKITQEMFAEMIEEITGGIVEVGNGYDPEVSEKTFETLEEAQENAAFDIKTPEYMPEGYEMARVYAFKDSDGSISGEYRNIVYKNAEGKEICIFERLLNENTAFAAGTEGTLEELTVNGRKAVIMDGRTLDFETEDNVSVGISTRGNVTRDELIKIAESIN